MKDPRLIAVVTTGTGNEAAAARNILESCGIRVFVDPPGDMHAVPPGGAFRVLVLAEDRGAAEEALASPASDALECRQGEADGDQSDPAAAGAAGATPDDCAVRAYRAALMYLVAGPMVLLVPYYFCRALWASRHQPVMNKRRFEKHMAVAAIMGILIPWGFLVISLT
jgi:hypothetical protein